MKYGILYAYWSKNWDCNPLEYGRLISKVSRIGFDVLEISAHHIYQMTNSDLEQLNELAERHGIGLVANSGPAKEYDLASPDPLVRKAGIDYFNTILRKMQIINSKTLAGAIYSYWPCDFALIDKEGAWERSTACLWEIGELAQRLGTDIALEVLNRNETYILTTAAEAVEFCRRVNCPSVKILLDTYHMNIEEDSMSAAIQQAGHLLSHVHVGECNRKLPGMNNSINWVKLGEALKQIGFKATVVLEPFILKGGSVGNSVRVWRDLSNNGDELALDRYAANSLAFLKQTFR